ncbi:MULTISPECIES: ATP-binding protein [unclassified Paludibacterium]|uniref:AAA family ATPase n=1 Tax=unclassified Paludibacterium TaxID=2618429 RepID=UPI001C049D9F|nr:ATP-binding protein [Paludibacterium sp. B53371]BEV73409.1 ATP-binding protein [Paludibacterium sp. THUN1379]
MPDDALHYPRQKLAESVLMMLDSGLSSALTLFAPRRMGKTEFLLKDLLPLAEQHGWRVGYHSFMEDDGHGGAHHFPAMLAAFADEEHWLARTLDKIGSHLLIRGQWGPASIENRPPSPTAPLPAVSQLIGDLAAQKKPVLLLLDEIQELARRSGSATLIASLRTGLDLHRDRVKVIFTGSSQAGLRAMFGDARAPFFHFATLIDFPPLDEGFTRHMAQGYQRITRRPLDEAALWQAFLQLGRVPLHLRALVEELALNPERTLTEALTARLNLLSDTSAFESRWLGLAPLEQSLLRAIAAGQHSPYRQGSRVALAAELGLPTLTPSQVQTALRKLERRDVVTRDAQGWRLADPVFAEWLKEHD